MKLSLASLTGWRWGAWQAFTRFPWNILCALIGAACCFRREPAGVRINNGQLYLLEK
jgi:hypothetical protein